VKLLLVEDDSSFGYILTEYLEMNGLETTWIQDGALAESEFKKNGLYDLIILDIMLPNKDGFTIAQEIRNVNPDVPFIFLTAKSLKIDKLKGFKMGCDDYIVKPIDEEVFIAKVKALLKRNKSSSFSDEQNGPIPIGNYRFDYSNQRLIRNGEKQKLTIKEAKLLLLLSQHKNHLVDRKRLLLDIWGSSDVFNRKSMDVFIFKLRKYLSKDPAVRITNIHGKGFVLEVDQSKPNLYLS